MSSYYCKVKIKKTGEIFDAQALDDYFGKHKYGYAIGTYVFREDEVEEVTNMQEQNKECEHKNLKCYHIEKEEQWGVCSDCGKVVYNSPLPKEKEVKDFYGKLLGGKYGLLELQAFIYQRETKIREEMKQDILEASITREVWDENEKDYIMKDIAILKDIKFLDEAKKIVIKN